jgi:hypothetical protein
VCENSRHGCGGRFRKDTVLGSREMLMYAYNRLKTKNPRAIIKANTNTLATALITSLADIRLVGEAIDAAGMDEVSRQWLHSSFRLGETTEFLWDETRWDAPQRALFATLVNFMRPAFERRSSFDDFDIYRSFDDGSGDWHLGISGDESPGGKAPGVYFNRIDRENGMLATAANASSSKQTVEIPMKDHWLACEPLAGRLHPVTGPALRVDLDAGGYRHFLLAPIPEQPQLLYALGARVPALQTLDSRAKTLKISVDAPEGVRLRFGVFTRASVRAVTGPGNTPIPFNFQDGGSLLSFEATNAAGRDFEITFN